MLDTLQNLMSKSEAFSHVEKPVVQWRLFDILCPSSIPPFCAKSVLTPSVNRLFRRPGLGIFNLQKLGLAIVLVSSLLKQVNGKPPPIQSTNLNLALEGS